jgi:hypothetical protein
MAQRRRPPRITEAHRAVLVEIVQAHPTATLEEFQSALEARTGIRAHAQTIQTTLREAGIERSLDGSSVRVEVATERPARYGYNEAHRRQEPEQTYPSYLTDAEWGLVEDPFGNEGGRGTPPHYSRRLLVDACSCVARMFLAHAAQRVPAAAERVPDVSALERAGETRADA